MKSCGYGVLIFLRAALICMSCVIPASRKVSGFVGQNAYRARSRYLKAFPTTNYGKKPDFIGIDWDKCSLCSMDSHH